MRKKGIKSIFIISILLIIILIFIIILKNNYKKINTGNNITNKTIEEFEEYIYNISSYQAIAQIIIKSNKNTNEYIVKQEYNKNEIIQEIIEPKNIEGVKTIYKDNILSVENTQLELKKIYDNYPYINDNILFLTCFIEEYKNQKGNNKTKIERIENEVIFTVECNFNNYRVKEELYLDAITAKPIKLIVQDNDKKDIIYILYNEIKFNS